MSAFERPGRLMRNMKRSSILNSNCHPRPVLIPSSSLSCCSRGSQDEGEGTSEEQKMKKKIKDQQKACVDAVKALQLPIPSQEERVRLTQADGTLMQLIDEFEQTYGISR